VAGIFLGRLGREKDSEDGGFKGDEELLYFLWGQMGRNSGEVEDACFGDGKVGGGEAVFTEDFPFLWFCFGLVFLRGSVGSRRRFEAAFWRGWGRGGAVVETSSL
jgi:hypothetical protein